MNTEAKRLETQTSDSRGILIGGLVAGTIDIAAASVINWRSPVVVCHAIASGVLGHASFQGGASSAILGLFLQWAISIIIAFLYCLIASRIRGLRKSWIVDGLIVGVAAFFGMNYVVVPLSAVGAPPRFSTVTFVENFLAILLYGLIIAFFVRRPNVKRQTSD